MCLLTFFDNGAMPDCEALLNGATYNDDGHGFAIVDLVNRRIIVEKGMRAEVMIDRFDKMRHKHPEGPALFHSRLTTDGIGGKYNVHPFHVNGYQDTVLGHNGIFPAEARPKLNDIRSDTRIVADNVAGKYGFDIASRKGRRKFARWMGQGNKVVILTLDPRFREHSYIINEHLGTWVGDVWYSNSSYTPRFRSTSTAKWWESDEWAEYSTGGATIGYTYQDNKVVTKEIVTASTYWDDCPVCFIPSSVQPSSQRCVECRSCASCLQRDEACQCWDSPRRKVEVDTKCSECYETYDSCTCGERLTAVLDSLPSVREQSVKAVTDTLSELGWPESAVKAD